MSIFPRWSDSVLRAGLVVFATAMVGVPTALWASVRSPINDGRGHVRQQPIAFDHRHHVVDDAIDCEYCHFDARRSPYAGIPDTRVCMHCHVQVWPESTLLAPVHTSFSSGTPIAWSRVADLPDFVFFEHRGHIRAGVGCETCHGRVDRMARVYRATAFRMEWCLECHRDPAPHLRPAELVTAMGVKPDRARGEAIARALDVRPPLDCTGCHR